MMWRLYFRVYFLESIWNIHKLTQKNKIPGRVLRLCFNAKMLGFNSLLAHTSLDVV